jgi:hypothetical protein
MSVEISAQTSVFTSINYNLVMIYSDFYGIYMSYLLLSVRLCIINYAIMQIWLMYDQDQS